jgi:hypothetical protein
LVSVSILGLIDTGLVRIYLMRKISVIIWNYFQGNVFGRRINGDGAAYCGGFVVTRVYCKWRGYE